MAIFDEKIEIRERCKGVHCVDLGESFPTRIYLQKSASIQPRTSPSKFGEKFNSLFTSLLTAAPSSRCPGTRERPVRRFLRRCGLRCVGRFPERLAEDAFFHDPGNCHLGSPLFIQLRQAKSLLYRSRFLHTSLIYSFSVM